MEKQTKSMSVTRVEIETNQDELQATSNRYSAIADFKPGSEEGKKASEKALAMIQGKMDTLRRNISVLQARLEVETIEMLAGNDTDLEEPTPTSAFRQAS